MNSLFLFSKNKRDNWENYAEPRSSIAICYCFLIYSAHLNSLLYTQVTNMKDEISLHYPLRAVKKLCSVNQS